MERFCPCVKDHIPNPKVLHRHHIVPKSWGGTDSEPAVYPNDAGVEGNLVALCPTSHENVHRLLNEYVRRQGVPPWKGVCQYYTALERMLAEVAWNWWSEHEHTAKPPWTATSGVDTMPTD